MYHKLSNYYLFYTKAILKKHVHCTMVKMNTDLSIKSYTVLFTIFIYKLH